jgi:NitT/TauT family transport system substrate-binding protein
MNRAEYVTSSVKIEPHINTEIYKKALDSLIVEYPNEKDFKALRASFKS